VELAGWRGRWTVEAERAGTGRFRGRVALVTGAGTGLGRAVAVRLASEGAAVAVNYARSEDEARTTVSQIEALGGASIPLQADVGDARAVEAMVTDVERALGPVDLLVPNAGITEYVPFSDLGSLTVELWERIMRVNLIGAFLCVRATAPRMAERGYGRVVLISSNSPFIVAGSCIPYVVSKGALISLTQCLAKALAPGVCVNAVAPGWMLTPWLDKYLPPDRAAWVRSGDVPTVDVQEVAQLVADLAANGAISGQVVVVDGGELVRRE
jgi:3-oxoacyl-[acyl-carrier protein] reductase